MRRLLTTWITLLLVFATYWALIDALPIDPTSPTSGSLLRIGRKLGVLKSPPTRPPPADPLYASSTERLEMTGNLGHIDPRAGGSHPSKEKNLVHPQELNPTLSFSVAPDPPAFHLPFRKPRPPLPPATEEARKSSVATGMTPEEINAAEHNKDNVNQFRPRLGSTSSM
ncbi:hypothetical protein H0H93_011069 [Arthromyces matolae]|nr:hypothetical protein H0H93_011069 [Arthromyces matolae]